MFWESFFCVADCVGVDAAESQRRAWYWGNVFYRWIFYHVMAMFSLYIGSVVCTHVLLYFYCFVFTFERSNFDLLSNGEQIILGEVKMKLMARSSTKIFLSDIIEKLQENHRTEKVQYLKNVLVSLSYFPCFRIYMLCTVYNLIHYPS